MKCSCKKGSGLGSAHSTSPYFLGCSSCSCPTTFSEFGIQQSLVSESCLSLTMGVLPQQCHNAKPLSFQFQDQDSSSSQSTDQSYPEVASAKSGIWIETLSISMILNCYTYQLVFYYFFLKLLVGILYISSVMKLQKNYVYHKKRKKLMQN